MQMHACIKCNAEGIVSFDALSMPHAMGAFVCVEPWARERWGAAAPAPPGLGCGTDAPANDRRPEIACALALNRPAGQRIHNRAIGP
jgi:hypothetical protein